MPQRLLQPAAFWSPRCSLRQKTCVGFSGQLDHRIPHALKPWSHASGISPTLLQSSESCRSARLEIGSVQHLKLHRPLPRSKASLAIIPRYRSIHLCWSSRKEHGHFSGKVVLQLFAEIEPTVYSLRAKEFKSDVRMFEVHLVLSTKQCP